MRQQMSAETTQAMCLLRSANDRMMNRLQNSTDHNVMMNLFLVAAAAVNVEAKLVVAAKQAVGKGMDRQARSKGKGSGGQGISGSGPQANNIQKRHAEGKAKQPWQALWS